MKISVDHVTNSSSESFGTVIIDTVTAIGLAIPFIAATMGEGGGSDPNTGEEGELPEENGYDYEPYPSTDPDDPAGTVIQKNQDGSMTKTHPDGTKGTKMPDGYIYVSAPDGTTAVIEPDGHQIITSPDGTKTEHYTNGTAYQESPDGSTRTEYPDGTVRVTKPDGTVVLGNPDGTTEYTEPGKKTEVIDGDGKIIGIKDEFGTNVTKDKDGNISGVMVTKDGEVFNASGTVDSGMTLESKNGSKIIIDENGKLKSATMVDENGKLVINEDGSIQANGKDKDTGVEFYLNFSAEKGLDYSDSLGNKIEVDPNGTPSGTFVDEKGTVELHKNGNIEAKNNDGSHDYVVPNEDGSVTWTNTQANGDKTVIQAGKDGDYEITAPEGGKVQLNTDGSIKLTGTNGVTKSYTADEVKKMTESAATGGTN